MFKQMYTKEEIKALVPVPEEKPLYYLEYQIAVNGTSDDGSTATFYYSIYFFANGITKDDIIVNRSNRQYGITVSRDTPGNAKNIPMSIGAYWDKGNDRLNESGYFLDYSTNTRYGFSTKISLGNPTTYYKLN